MNYWLLADTHFGHDKIKLESFEGRPEGFEGKILRSCEHHLNVGDVVIHLGDFCFYNEHMWHNRFLYETRIKACRSILIRGNHDKKSLSWYLDQGWSMVADELRLNIFGKSILFSHKPVTVHDDFDLNIHGHLHGRTEVEGITEKHRLISMDKRFAPVSLRSAVEGMK